MLTRTLLSSPLLVTTLGLAPHLAGCLDTTIVGGEGGGGGATGDESVAVVATVSTGGTGGAASASAWLEAALDEPTLLSTCMGDLCEGDDLLFLFIDALGSSCADPFTSDISMGMGPDPSSPNSWTVAIGVPPSRQEVGLHTIDDTFLVTSGESIATPSGPSVGAVSTGLGWTGTLEILELTDTTVRFVTTGLDKPSDGVEYAAPRCGVVDLPPEGIAIAGDAIGGTGAGGGASAEEDGLTFVVGNELATCTDALATTCTGETWQVAVSLPGDYVTPGLYALTDPRITVTNCTAQPKFLGGTIEVLDVDETEVIIRLADVVDHQAELEQELRVARCP